MFCRILRPAGAKVATDDKNEGEDGRKGGNKYSCVGTPVVLSIKEDPL